MATIYKPAGRNKYINEYFEENGDRRPEDRRDRSPARGGQAGVTGNDGDVFDPSFLASYPPRHSLGKD